MPQDKIFYFDVERQSEVRYDLAKLMRYTDNHDPFDI